MRFVAVKTGDQQAGQALHRIRSRLIKSRTARERVGAVQLYSFVGCHDLPNWEV